MGEQRERRRFDGHPTPKRFQEYDKNVLIFEKEQLNRFIKKKEVFQVACSHIFAHLCLSVDA